MCIRDRCRVPDAVQQQMKAGWLRVAVGKGELLWQPERISCLLYTSDAADERSSVDLGGGRIIKKNTNEEIGEHSHNYTHKPYR